MAAGKDPDWQGNSNLKDCNKHLLENELYTDVEFQVGDEGTLIKAHKLMLAKRSPVFERMLYGPMAETKYPIVISDIEPEAFRALLRYCYLDDNKVEKDLALPTMYAAKKYMISTLEESCKATLVKSLDSTNIWEVYTSSVMTPDRYLNNECQKYLGKNVSEVAKAFKSPDFLRIPHCVLLNMLQMNKTAFKGHSKGDNIMLSEIEVFKVCNAWAETECMCQELEPSGPNKRTVLGDCLFLIRLPLILAEDLVKVVFPTEILIAEEKFSLLEHIHGGATAKDSPYQNFLSRTSSYWVYIKPFTNAGSVIEYSPIQERDVEYSFIRIKPRSRISITGLVLANEKRKRLPTKHEVFMKAENLSVPWSKSIISCSTNDRSTQGKYSPRYLEFEEVYLEADCEYHIKAEKNGTKFDPTDCKITIPSAKVKGAGEVDIEITDGQYNDCITFILIRLV